MLNPDPPGEPPLRIRLALRYGRKATILVSVLAVLAILACAGGFGTVFVVGFRTYWAGGSEPYPTAEHPSGTFATSTAGASAAGGPFAGTPAHTYPEGAAGITLPPARATGDFTAKQVADALASVKRALVASHLDEATLVEGNAEAFIALLAIDSRADIHAEFVDGTASGYSARIAPGARLTEHQPRVSGRMTYSATTDPDGIRIIQVTTNFVWVYSFVPADITDPGLVIMHDEIVWEVPHPDDVRLRSAGLWLTEWEGYVSNMDCTAADQGYLAPAGPDDLVAPGPGSDEDPDAVFDPERAVEIEDTC
jgi:hypothetical protein